MRDSSWHSSFANVSVLGFKNKLFINCLWSHLNANIELRFNEIEVFSEPKNVFNLIESLILLVSLRKFYAIMSNCSMNTVSTMDNYSSLFTMNISSLNHISYLVILPSLIFVGILGNLLNLMTLRNITLRSVPFRYVQAMAVYDTVGLVLLIFVVLRAARLMPNNIYGLAYYQAHFELPAINSFLTASLFTAVSLTVVRHKLICKPYSQLSILPCSLNPRLFALVNIIGAFMLAALLHVPMSFEYLPLYSPCVSLYRRINNPVILNEKPFAQLYKSYQVIRELIRVSAVIILVVLNLNITITLQQTKKKRREMIPSNKRRRSSGLLLLCFSEKKLTMVMATVTIVYVFGNIPAAFLMIFNNDAKDRLFAFHVFRAFANLAEISNHCLNFYLFCLTSRDYWRAFMNHFDVRNVIKVCCKDNKLSPRSFDTPWISFTKFQTTNINNNTNDQQATTLEWSTRVA